MPLLHHSNLRAPERAWFPVVAHPRRARGCHFGHYALVLGLAGGLPWPAAVLAMPVSSAFTYQGELRAGGVPANASFDMEFRLYDAAAGGSQIGPVVNQSAVPATDGLFSVQLDFGPAQFAGDRQWLELRIKPAGTGSYETLSPRTELTAAPYALGAVAALANSVTTTSIVDGSIGSVDIDPGQIQRRVSGACPVGQFLRQVNPDGSVICAVDADAGGTVTSIATGAGLSGGPITGSGTISVAAGGIGATQIDAAQVQRRIAAGCPDGQHLSAVNEDGTVVCGIDTIGPPGWTLNGNAATDPLTNFIGTTDAQPLVLRTHNVPSLRIEPSELLYEGIPITTNTTVGSSANLVFAGVFGATIGGGGVPTGAGPVGGLTLRGPNLVEGHFGTVGGGMGNRASFLASVGGGQRNLASGQVSTVAGGDLNVAGGSVSTVGGGQGNVAGGLFSSVGGGEYNLASGRASAVAGGQENLAGGDDSSVGGGEFNQAVGDYSLVAGGLANSALGDASVVGGGALNCAGGNLSWAGGNLAKVRPGTDPGGTGACAGLTYPGGIGDVGSFVWADSQFENFTSTGPNQFLIRAQGGTVITASSGVRAPVGNMLRVVGTMRVDVLGSAGSAVLCRNANNQLSSCSSSARYKRDIGELDMGLAEALRLQAVAYRWKESGEADIGFVAEEVAEIDERLVSYDDQGRIEGVKYDRLSAVLANAVQELAARDSLNGEILARLERENRALRTRHAALQADTQELRGRLLRLESRLDAQINVEP